MVKIQKDNIARPSPVLQADSLPLNHWGSPLKKKEEKILFIKIGKLPGDLLIKDMPVQVRCTILDAWGWCTGTTQRDGMGREEGGGFRMGNTCIPVADSF